MVTNDTLKILGVTLDCKLNFAAYVKEQAKKTYAKATALRRIGRFIPSDIMTRLYKAFILSHLEYCCLLLLGASRCQLKKLEDTNYYILWSILGYGKNTPYDYLLEIVKIKMLEQRRKFQALVLVYRCMNNQASPYIQDFLNTKICNYNLRGSDTLLMLLNINLKWIVFIFSSKDVEFITSIC